MKRIIIALAVLLASFTATVKAEVIESQSEDGLFIIRAQTEPWPPIVGNNTITLTVLDSRSKNPVEGAEVEVVPWMTLHGHGSSKKTRIQEKGKGIYVIESVYFTMAGDWDLLIKIRRSQSIDRAIITFKDVRS